MTTPLLHALDSLAAGAMLGRYQYLLPIARGGMASVWVARTLGARGFERIVALKTMLPLLSDDPSFTVMFLEEARIASRIRHPNVVQVIDLGEEGDLIYLVMEWIDGDPLNVILNKAHRSEGGIPIHLGARIVIDACAGLHAAHELRDDDGASLGLVHRDISPQNILLDMSGTVKIVDFGIAKLTHKHVQETAPGQVRGKLAYMAPEQATGQGVDRRSDIFAMGAVLYQLLTSKHPFRGESDLETMQNILGREVPPPRRVSDRPIGEALETVVLKALSRDPEKRFGTAAEMARALEEAVASSPPRDAHESLRDFLRRLVGDRAATRAESIRRATMEADRGVTRGDSIETPSFPEEVSAGLLIAPAERERLLDANLRSVRTDRKGPTADSPPRIEAGEAIADPAGAAATSAPPKRPPRRLPFVLGGAVLLLLGLGAGLALRRDPPRDRGDALSSASSRAAISEAPAPSAGTIDPSSDLAPIAPRSSSPIAPKDEHPPPELPPKPHASPPARATTSPLPPAPAPPIKHPWAQPVPNPGF